MGLGLRRHPGSFSTDGAAAAAIEGIAFSGQMMGVVLVGDDGKPIRPSIIWADTRSRAQCERLNEAVGAEHAYAILGHRLNPTYSLSKLMWVREQEPETFGAATKMCWPRITSSTD